MSLLEKLRGLRFTIKDHIRRLIVNSLCYYTGEVVTQSDEVSLVVTIAFNAKEIYKLISTFDVSKDRTENQDRYIEICRHVHDFFSGDEAPDFPPYEIQGTMAYVREYNSLVEEILARYHKALFYVESEIDKLEYLENDAIDKTISPACQAERNVGIIGHLKET